MTNTPHPTDQKAAVSLFGADSRRRIARLKALPPLPYREQEIVKLLSDPDLDLLSLVELVEQTPALSARLLGVANSAYFGNAVQVKRISDAIIRVLGLNLVRDLSLSLILSQQFRIGDCRRFDMLRFWKHAMYCAILADGLAPSVSVDAADERDWAYLGGLLHSLGVLALVHLEPQAMDDAFGQAAGDPNRTLSSLEKELLGIDHCEAGAAVARAWQLPDPLTAVVQHHRDPQYRGRHWRLVVVVGLADRISLDRLATGGGDDAPKMLHIAAVTDALDALGIPFEVLQQAYRLWVHHAERIDQLAAAFARPLP